LKTGAILLFLFQQNIQNLMESLSPTARKFVLHWGEMGVRWGINRTVAQVHALLFLADRPLPADEIADTLAIARSNTSTSLRELQNWGIAKIVHLAGDRRDHFETIKDVFAMFRVIAHERKKREIDPTISVLRDCIAEAAKPKSAEAYTRERLTELLEVFELGASVYDRVEKLPTPAVLKIAKLGDKALRMLGVAGK
jgi:DNA-binding transcriptional regulator GbsR (MarR family)